MTAGPSETPFDSGLQSERTLLAWQRTCLALAIGNALAIRYLADALGHLAAVIGIIGLALSAAAWVSVSMRYRRTEAASPRHGSLVASGRLPLLMAGSVVAAGVAGAVILVAVWWPW